MAAVAAVARRGSSGEVNVTTVADAIDNSVLLEVGGELTVPNVQSKEQLAEMLASGKYILDLRGAEIRFADGVRQEVFDALGLGLDELKSRIVLNGVVSRAPPGSDELVRKFLRKGTREQHFAVVRELARRRREELDQAVRKRPPQPGRMDTGRLEWEDSTAERPQAVPTTAEGAKSPVVEAVIVTKVDEAGPVTAATTTAKKDKLVPQHYEELTTSRSATTASDLGTARLISDM